MKTNRVKAFDLREELENNYGVTPESLLNYLMDCWMSGDDILEAVKDFKNDVVNNQNSQNSPRTLIYKINKKDMKKLDYEVLERIEGLVNQRDLELFKNALENITNDLEEEMFHLSDVKAYFQLILNEYLGDQ